MDNQNKFYVEYKKKDLWKIYLILIFFIWVCTGITSYIIILFRTIEYPEISRMVNLTDPIFIVFLCVSVALSVVFFSVALSTYEPETHREYLETYGKRRK